MSPIKLKGRVVDESGDNWVISAESNWLNPDGQMFFPKARYPSLTIGKEITVEISGVLTAKILFDGAT